MKRTGIIAAAIAAIIAVGMGTSAHAQQQQPSYSDSEIQTFAAAVSDVQQINQKYQPKMQAAETQDQQQAVRDKATDEMIEAIREQGLTVKEYNQISEAVRSDPELGEKVRQHLQ